MLERRTGFGIDRLLADPSAVAGKRIGLITNPSGVTSRGIPTWQALLWSEAKLARLFGPEHGVDGSALYMEAVGNATHAASGLPAVSLYGRSVETLRPRPEHLEGLDAIVFDVADVGSRYYTYNWTMLLAMEACAAAGVRFIVCDRPNPLGGEVEGAPQDPEFLSFVGLHPVSVRHGMTTGELARLVLAETKLDLDLEVVPAIGWARAMPYEETGLPWVPPSPNIPSVATARVYPGMALLEGTNLSEARGTTKPFEMFGAPWLSPPALSGALEALGLPGVSFLPVYFRPEFEKHAGVVCGGAAMHVTEPDRFRGFETGLRVIETARQLDTAEFRWRKEPYEFDPRPAVDLLSGSARFRETLDAGAVLSEEIARHRAGAEGFRKRREPYLIYPERRPAVVSFVGGHGAGKTTLLVELVPRLTALGLRVGVIKHSSKDAEDDVPGKDSQRLAASGAAVSAFVTPARATVRRLEDEKRIQDLIRRDFSDCDLVLVEGYKSLDFPRIEVARRGAPRPEIAGAMARVSDQDFGDATPTFSFGDHDGIIRDVLRAAGLDRPGARG